MNNEKLIRLGKNLSDLFSNVETPTDVYVHLMELARKQREYFLDGLGLENLVKLSIIIWCIKENKLQSLESIFNNLEFITLFSHNSEEYNEECEHCNGDGSLDCSDCDGTGRIDCENCNSRGTTECELCGGTGKDEETDNECENCAGSGEELCGICGGNATFVCENCSGKGYVICDECDGMGEIKTGEILYNITKIISWNRELNAKSRIIENTIEPLISEDELLDPKVSNEIIISYFMETNHMEIFSDIEPDIYYLVELNDHPDLDFDFGKISWEHSLKNVHRFEK